MKKQNLTSRILSVILVLLLVISGISACSGEGAAETLSGGDLETPSGAKTDKSDDKIQEDNLENVPDNNISVMDENEPSADDSYTKEVQNQELAGKEGSSDGVVGNTDKASQEDKSAQEEINDVKELVHIEDDTEGLEGAVAFVRRLRLGWNLGNTMDATNSATSGSNLNLETSWSGARTTPKMIKMIKDAGFKSIRVPVSWHNHVDSEFNIDPAWMARVKEIVDYVIDEDMYCTINIHHDNLKGYFYPSSDCLDESVKYVKRIWEQVGEVFKDYDDHLIFESLNEPRLVGTSNEWNLSNNDACRDAIQCINKLNQTFVDVVRSQGGNNPERYLLVPGYAAQWNAAVRDDFVIPSDTADNKILIEVHAYSPYNFALQAPTDGSSKRDFSEDENSSTSDIRIMVQRLKEVFVDKGIGVVIDEFGSRDKDGNTEARVAHAAYYVKKAREYGITCFWWDNNCFFGSGERFGLLNRKNDTFMYPEIVQALVDNCR